MEGKPDVEEVTAPPASICTTVRLQKMTARKDPALTEPHSGAFGQLHSQNGICAAKA